MGPERVARFSASLCSAPELEMPVPLMVKGSAMVPATFTAAPFATIVPAEVAPREVFKTARTPAETVVIPV